MNPNLLMKSENILDYLEKIREEYCDFKFQYSILWTRIKELETENEQLKQKHSTSGDDSSENKRRKTSIDKHELQVNAPVDDSDDEVINGTPQPVQKNVIKERNKKANRSSRLSNAVTPVTILPALQGDCISPVHAMHKDDNALPIRKTTEEKSPLRGIENTNTKGSCTKLSRSVEDAAKWITIKTPSKTSNVFIGTIMDPKAHHTTPPQRKLKSLSLSKQKPLKQSTIKFLPPVVKAENISTLSNNLLADMDETYCNELSVPLQIGLSTTEKTRDKENNEKLFNFRSKQLDEPTKLQIKPEPHTPKSRSNCTAVSSKSPSKELRFAFESSSVFEVPNATDDIICLEDSEPLFSCLDDLADQMPAKPTEIKLSPENPVRTEYRQHIEARTKRDKAAQPGHMCPDCADWYKRIGPELNDRELQRRLNACSRHRKEMVMADTPDGFWVPFFEPTQPNETSFKYRLQNRQQLHKESQNY